MTNKNYTYKTEKGATIEIAVEYGKEKHGYAYNLITATVNGTSFPEAKFGLLNGEIYLKKTGNQYLITKMPEDITDEIYGAERNELDAKVSKRMAYEEYSRQDNAKYDTNA